ncbi:translocation/assembly module TamB domain-containing protein [Sutterella sp.]|uniref:translocation/assembly module TamB domain-containing protein n=1 Tax=Sutterella sp. TaxID=1981025 RepID=UPI0026DF2B31|nr:translocation/assembly module TamB domain-containing protein [Sutterella sp.]MDO5531141.1 translocation/assembly module TamB domain-containing protein [Sutterella sp.]
MARPVRIVLGAFAVLLSLVVFIVAAAAFLVLTPPGLSLVGKAADRWVPGLSIGAVEGGWSDLRVKDVGWSSPGVDVKAGLLELSLDWRRLFDKEARVARLALTDTTAAIDPEAIPASEPAPEDTAPLDLPAAMRLPWPVSVDVLELTNLKFSMPGTDLSLGSLKTGAALRDGILTIPGFDLGELAAGVEPADVSVRSLTLAADFDGRRAHVANLTLDGARVKLAQAAEAPADGAPATSEVSGTPQPDASAPAADAAPESAAPVAPAASSENTAAAEPAAAPEAAPLPAAAETAAESPAAPAGSPAPAAPAENAAEPAAVAQAEAGEAGEPAKAAKEEVPSAAQAFTEQFRAFFAKPLMPALPEVSVPLAVEVDRLALTDVVVEGIPGAETLPVLAPFELTSLTLAASAEGSKVAVKDLELASSVADITLTADATLAGTWPVAASGSVHADAAPWLEIAGLRADTPDTTLGFSVSGDVGGELAVSADLKGIADLTLRAAADASKAELPFSLEVAAEELRIPALINVPAPAAATASATAAASTQTAAPAAESAEAAEPAQKTEETTSEEKPAASPVNPAMPDLPVAAAPAAAGEKPKEFVLTTDLDELDRKVAEERAKQGLPPKRALAPEPSPMAYAPPLSDTLMRSRYRVSGFSLKASGTPGDWHAELTAKPRVDAPAPILGERRSLDGTVSFNADGTFSEIALRALDVLTPLGNVALKGNAKIARDISWKGEFKVADVNAEELPGAFPFLLDEATVASTGLVRPDGTFRIDSATAQLAAAIEKIPLTLNTALSGENGVSWKVGHLNLVLGKNTLDLSGEVEHLRGITLDLALKAPDLANSVPGLTGRAEGTVKLAGSLAHPIAKVNLTASKLGWQDLFSLETAKVFVDLKNSPFRTGQAPAKPGEKPSGARPKAPPPPGDNASFSDRLTFIVNSLADGEISGDLSVAVSGITASGQEIEDVSVSLTGTELRHRLNLKVSSEPVHGTITADGGFSRDTFAWKGTLSEAVVGTPAGDFKAAKAAALDWNPKTERFTIGEHCWRWDKAEVCLPEPMTLGRSGKARLALTELNMDIFKPYLPKRRDEITGTVTAEVEANWNLDKNPMPSVRAELNGDGLGYATHWQGVTIPVEFERLRAHALFSGQRLVLAWDLKPAGNGTVEGQVAVIDPMGKRRLDGRIQVNDLTPALIEPFLSRNEKASGTLHADLRPGGTLEAPELRGEMSARGILVAADFIPIEMEPSDLTITFTGRQSKLEGEVRTKTETVKLSGSADWRNLKKWTADASVSTEGIHVEIPPMVKIDVKGNAVVTASPERVRLDGRIEIPKSSVEVQDLPASYVSVSEDQVLLDADLNPITIRGEGLPVESDLDVILGDDVRVAAYGLRASLTGALKVVMLKSGLGLVGQINIPEGRFRAYGQDLLIQTGQILFSGATDNPSLRIDAIRNPENTADDVTAGIRVTGTASAPTVTIYSSPELSEQEALSYLLRGEGLGSDDGSSSAMMTSMLIGLGTSQSNGILSEVGDAVGLKGLGVDTTGVGDSQQVVVSAYVLPGLQVKYGIGIFDSLATITLRYRLMPKLYLEAVSGVNQALDLLYRFEF